MGGPIHTRVKRIVSIAATVAATIRSMSHMHGRWGRAESNRRRQPFQGCALPTELPPQFWSCLQKQCHGL
jgi:hypothetical protein